METFLPLFFAAVMGLALLIYVLLDGYDLGIGLLLPLGSDSEKDTMIASIGPFWDANETWIVLGIGVLLIAFPKAHGIVLTSLYLPVTFMLMGLILRGVAFDFRVKAGDSKKPMWNRLFFVGSLVASLCQGWMLGAFITGLQDNLFSSIFSALIAITLPALYIMLGSAWLLIKTENELFEKALSWAKFALLPTGITLLMVSIATPLVSEVIAQRWFSLPNFIGLLPIPLTCLLAYIGITWLLTKPHIIKAGYSPFIFIALAVICLMSSIGLAFSLYPDIIIGQLTIQEAASSTESLKFTFVGTVITLPAIIAYTIFIYKVFGGKATHLSYGLND